MREEDLDEYVEIDYNVFFFFLFKGLLLKLLDFDEEDFEDVDSILMGLWSDYENEYLGKYNLDDVVDVNEIVLSYFLLDFIIGSID